MTLLKSKIIIIALNVSCFPRDIPWWNQERLRSIRLREREREREREIEIERERERERESV